jgi:hypothetical protein
VTDDDWEQQRNRAILTAFQTGRTVFADTDGELRFADGNQEAVPEDVGLPKPPVPSAVLLMIRAERWSRRAFALSIVTALVNGIAAYWHPWQLVLAIVFLGNAVVCQRLNRRQRALLEGTK